MAAILMTEECWASSQLSIARYYGHIKFNGHEYTICDKRGMTLFECSVEAERLGKDKAIEPGEPADLIRNDFIPLYKKLGRDKFIETLKASPNASDKELKKIMESCSQ